MRSATFSALLLAGCAAPPAPSGLNNPSPDSMGGPSIRACAGDWQFTGRLRSDHGAAIVVGHYQTLRVDWPDGYRAELAPIGTTPPDGIRAPRVGMTLIDDSGRTVASEGDVLSLAGVVAADDLFVACRLGINIEEADWPEPRAAQG